MLGLTISQVAKAANVNIETVKYYERRELLAKPKRSDSGYRLYTEDTIQDILLIKRAQELGFTLNEIKHVLALVKQEGYFPAEEMYTFALAKIQEISEKIKQLESFRSLLEQAVAAPGTSAATSPRSKQDCPLLIKLGRNDVTYGEDH